MSDSSYELNREESKARKLLARSCELALKGKSRGSGWRISDGVLFRQYKNWFVSCVPAVWIGRYRATIEVHIKPMLLDPLFWDIVEAQTNINMPLSFRYHGSWTCRTPAFYCEDIAENLLVPEKFAAEVFSRCSLQLLHIDDYSIENFRDFLQQHERSQSYIATITTTLLLLEQFSDARNICTQELLLGNAGGFSVTHSNGTSEGFFDLALKWLDRNQRQIH